MHPYKWKANSVEIPIPESTRAAYGLADSVRSLRWLIEPDLKDERRTYLSQKIAILADILVTNQWKRPIHYSLGMNPNWYRNLAGYLELSGLTYRLIPVSSGGAMPRVDVDRTKALFLESGRFSHLASVEEKDYSRISGLPRTYLAVLHMLLQHYLGPFSTDGMEQELRQLLRVMDADLPEEIAPRTPQLDQMILKLREKLG